MNRTAGMIARAAHIPMLEPADSQECHDYIQRAFELSERYDTPVFLRLTTRLAHQPLPGGNGRARRAACAANTKKTL